MGQLNKWPYPQDSPLVVATVLQGLVRTNSVPNFICDDRGQVNFGKDVQAGLGLGP